MNAREDRQSLGISIAEYRDIALALSTFCYVNKHGQHVRIARTKRNKLKNMRHSIQINKVKSRSPIYLEMLRQLNIQINKCERRPPL